MLNPVGMEVGCSTVMSPDTSDIGFAVVELLDLLDLGGTLEDLR